MPDSRLIKLAELLVNYSVDIQPKDWVLIESHVIAEPLLGEVLRAVLQAGGRPQILLHSDTTLEYSLKYADEEQLQWISPASKLMIKEIDAWIYLQAFENTRLKAGIDPQKEQILAKTRQPLVETYLNRAAAGELRWTLTNYPCSAFAQDADMSLSDYETFVYSATFCDQQDPIAEWQRIHDEQQEVIDWIEGKKNVVLKGPNVDLSLSIEGRTWKNSDGKNNMPSGEIFTGPIEDSANGWVNFTYPAISKGKEVTGVRLELKDGQVVKASAKKNEEFLLSELDTDEGSRYLGEFAIGTNYGIKRFTKNILYDEKIGGSFHIALGNGYPETGSKNVSGIHWDMICDIQEDSEILVDGELLYKDGKFMI